jgi:sulfate adenylyltransferase subunit 1
MTACSPADAPQRALRFLTAGSVDDGKSTLIGRLLYDTRAILADQAEALVRRAGHAGHETRERFGDAGFDLSLLTDGLEAEREQGITIDVAFRYFATPRRKFIIADAPGHEQYTRNMVTAAAGSDAAVVLVDLTKLEQRPDDAAFEPALLPQTRRHALLAHLLRVPHLVFALNKIDAVGDPAAAFAAASRALRRFAAEAGLELRAILPVSALNGDNVTTALQASWYGGPSLLELLESLPAAAEVDSREGGALLMPVQSVARHDATDPAAGANPERAFWGRIARGAVHVGDRVRVLPSGREATVTGLLVAGCPAPEAPVGRSAGLVLDQPLDISRGDWIVAAEPAASGAATRRFRATLAWLDTEPAAVGRKLWLRHAHRWVAARIVDIDHRVDVTTLQRLEGAGLAANDIGEVTLETAEPLPVEPYARNRVAGSMILVDPASHRTSGAVLVQEAA